jgi:peptide/nickel transport system substrate-binding protein
VCGQLSDGAGIRNPSQKLMTFVSEIEFKDGKTLIMKLKEPTGLVLLGLSKPSSNVPFMMPKRVAETNPNT